MSAFEVTGIAAAVASTKAGTKVLFIMARFLRAHRLFRRPPSAASVPHPRTVLFHRVMPRRGVERRRLMHYDGAHDALSEGTAARGKRAGIRRLGCAMGRTSAYTEGRNLLDRKTAILP